MARSESQRWCPREPELARLVAGQLSGEAGAELRRHVHGCAICRERVENMDGAEGAVFQEVRSVFDTVAQEPEAMGAKKSFS